MKTRSFAEELQYARAHTYAVGAFNIFNYLSARAVIRAASTLNCPVILQTSSATVRKFGPAELGTMLRQWPGMRRSMCWYIWITARM